MIQKDVLRAQYTILPNSKNSGNLSWKTEYESEKLVIGSCIVYQNSNFHPHYHDVTEIYKIIDGYGKVFIKSIGIDSIATWKDVEPGDIIIIPPYTFHSVITNSKIELTYIFDKGPFNTIKYYGWQPSITNSSAPRMELNQIIKSKAKL